MNERETALFNLIDTAYNHLPEKYADFELVLLKSAQILSNDHDYLKAVKPLYVGLQQLQATDRINIPEIHAITAWIIDDFQKMDAKRLRDVNAAYGISSIPIVF